MQHLCKSHVHLFSVFVFLNYLTIITCNPCSPYFPIHNLALNCGSSAISTDPDGREWTGDIGSKFISSRQPNDGSIVSNCNSEEPSVDHIPYNTARIFVSQFTYTFHVSPGQKFIRFYFHPAKYQGFDRSRAYFTVTAGPFTLLRNFSVSLTADSLGSKFLVKEFCLQIEEDKRLKITFTPSTNTSDNAYAFINGIEIVSMPTSVYYTRFGDKGVQLAGLNSHFLVENNTALEMVHRLNVGGSSISPMKDSAMMYRKWSGDTNFFVHSGVNPINNRAIHIKYTSIPAYTAPVEVYQTARSTRMSKEGNKWYNLTWRLPVDSGFKYLVRLHFCQIQAEVKKSGNMGFHISIRNKTVETSANIIAWSGGPGIPLYRDYAVMIPKNSNGKTYLFIHLRPNPYSSAGYSEAILNGLELFKLNNSDANLAGPNPEVPVHPPTPPKPWAPDPKTYSKDTKSLLFLAIFGAALGVAIVFFLLGLTMFWQRKRAKSNNNQKSPSLEGLCRRFTLEEIRAATKNFDRNLIIGRGGCGHVYKGYIDGGLTPVAFKMFGPTSRQGYPEFQTEIEMLSKLRHPHLVSLIGYCDDERVMIIVYDFMAHKTLRHHLYNTNNPPLSWKQRLEICIGTARGLRYLHEGPEHTIIHRDVKTSNILLDQDWVAKVSDFGLSRYGPTSLSKSHVTTKVRGTFGYLDPDYFLTSHLTVKSDVYGFGVVLFEVLCARPAVDHGLDDDQHSLAQWSRRCFEEGTLDQIIDSRVMGMIAPECLKAYTKIAYRCLCDERNQRPTMAEVLRALEVAMELQEIADGGAHRIVIDEEVPLCGGGNLVMSRPGNRGDLVHSCPTFWKKSISSKELLRFLSDKGGLKWVRGPPNPRCLKACRLGSPEYNALPRVHVQVPDLSCCGPYTTPGKILVEITNIEGQ